MKRFIVALALVFAAAVYAADQTSYFAKVGTLTTGAPDAGTAIASISGGGTFVKVSCIEDAYVGIGTTGALCLLPDAGIPCDFIRFSVGEKFYTKAPANFDRVTAYMSDAGVQKCGVFEARN